MPRRWQDLEREVPGQIHMDDLERGGPLLPGQTYEVGEQGEERFVPGAICGPPMHLIKTEAAPERWCFGERKRRTGTWSLMGPDKDWIMANEAYGWAEPVWRYRCDGCGEDRRFGFGGGE